MNLYASIKLNYIFLSNINLCFYKIRPNFLLVNYDLLNLRVMKNLKNLKNLKYIKGPFDVS